MAEFKKKNRYGFWCSPLVLFILLGLFLFLAYKVIILIKIEKETRFKKEISTSEMTELLEREDNLKKEILKMQTEEGIEETIRGKFQVAKEGEKMVTIIEEEKKEILSDEIPSDYSFWKKLINVFKK